MYWKIEKWKVVEFYRELPRVIWNTQLGKNITNKELKEFWILPVVWNSQPLEEWQSYWKKNYKIKKDNIIETKEVIDEDIEQYKEKKKKQLNKKIEQEIKQEYNLEKQIKILINKEDDIKKFEDMKKFINNKLKKNQDDKKNIWLFSKNKEVKDYVDSLYINETI